MWIKTQSGELLNTDSVSTIKVMEEYDRKVGQPVARFQVLSWQTYDDNCCELFAGTEVECQRYMSHLSLWMECREIEP